MSEIKITLSTESINDSSLMDGLWLLFSLVLQIEEGVKKASPQSKLEWEFPSARYRNVGCLKGLEISCNVWFLSPDGNKRRITYGNFVFQDHYKPSGGYSVLKWREGVDVELAIRALITGNGRYYNDLGQEQRLSITELS